MNKNVRKALKRILAGHPAGRGSAIVSLRKIEVFQANILDEQAFEIETMVSPRNKGSRGSISSGGNTHSMPVNRAALVLPAERGEKDDTEWNEKGPARLVAHSDLSRDQEEVIRFEYFINTTVRVVPWHGALIGLLRLGLTGRHRLIHAAFARVPVDGLEYSRSQTVAVPCARS